MYEQIASNKRRTVLLVLGAIVFLGLIGYAIGLFTSSGPVGLIAALVVAVVMALGSYFAGDRIVLASTRACAFSMVACFLTCPWPCRPSS